MSLILYFLCFPSVKLLLLQRRCVFYYYNAVFLASFGREGTIKADCDVVLFFMTLCLEVVNHFLKDNWCLCSLGESCLMFRSHTHDFHNGEIQCFFCGMCTQLEYWSHWRFRKCWRADLRGMFGTKNVFCVERPVGSADKQ